MHLSRLSGRIGPALHRPLSDARMRLTRAEGRLGPALQLPLADARMQLSRIEMRFTPWRLRDRTERLSEQLALQSARLRPAVARLQRERGDSLAALARMLRTLGPNETLARGFAIIRDGEGRVLQRAAGIASGQRLEIQFADDRVNALTEGGTMAEGEARTGVAAMARSAGKTQPTKSKAPAKAPEKNSKQGSLF